jgi:glucose-1-phosphate thymidylyltransferase
MDRTGLVVVSSETPRGDDESLWATRRVANRPIACHAIESLAEAGIERLAVVAPPDELSEIRECLDGELGAGITPTYLAQTHRSDLLGAIRTAAPFVNGDPTVLHVADGLLGQALIGAVPAREEELPDLLLMLHRGDGSQQGLEPSTQKLLGLTEINGRGARLALAGVCVFGPALLERAAQTPSHSREPIGIIAIAEHLASTGSRLEASVARCWRRYRGAPADLLELNRIVLDQQIVHGETVEHGDNRIEGRAVIHPTAEVRSSIVLGPCIIGAGARVADSYIGPYTSIGARADIEGAEIVRSIIAEDVRIKHIGGRIEGSTIGRHANIFRDFGLPRALRLHVGDGVEVGLN